jgi:hypothetical protein
MESTLPPSESLESTLASLAFFRAPPGFENEKPYYISHSLPPEYESRRTNLEYERHSIPVHGIRGHEHHLHIEKDGVQFITRQSEVEFNDTGPEEQEKVEAYLKETVKWARDLLNANFCVAYSYVVSKQREK